MKYLLHSVTFPTEKNLVLIFYVVYKDVIKRGMPFLLVSMILCFLYNLTNQAFLGATGMNELRSCESV